MSPILADLTVVTIWTALPVILLTFLIRVAWRRKKDVEEP